MFRAALLLAASLFSARKECQFGECFLQKSFPLRQSFRSDLSLRFRIAFILSVSYSPDNHRSSFHNLVLSGDPDNRPTFRSRRRGQEGTDSRGQKRTSSRGRLHLWRSKWENNDSKTEPIGRGKKSFSYFFFLSCPYVLWSRACLGIWQVAWNPYLALIKTR